MSSRFDGVPRIVQPRAVESIASAIRRISEGNFVGAVPPVEGVLRPISDELNTLKKVFGLELETLHEQQERLDHIVNSIPNAALLFDADKLVLYNSAAIDLFAINRTHIGKTLAELPLPQAIKTGVSTLPWTEDPTAPRVFDTAFDPIQNTYRVRVVALEPGSSKQPGMLVVISDTSARSRTDQLRKDFVVAASHELKTPVAGIGLLSENAVAALEDGDQEMCATFVNQIHQEARNLARLVSDLLDLSRFEDSTPRKSVSDVRAISQTALQARQGIATSKGLDLILEESQVAQEEVYAKISDTDLTIIIDNLIDNALAYTDSGTVTLTITVDAYTVFLTVLDTGIGLDPAEKDRIFERFYRVDRSRSRVSGGTGLGLALVKHAVNAAKGSIDVNSTPGAGTTFTVSLPRAY